MKAIIRSKAGKQLKTMVVRELASPPVGPLEVKVKMASARINPVDIDLMKGMPFLRYKNPQIGGIDGSGIITAIGSKIKNFKEGDAVFFYRKFTDIGTWAEEIVIPEKNLALIPSNLSVTDAGAITLPLLTAYEGLLQLEVQSGESLLIHGAGGGVGFQVVQLAIAKGLRVIATASARDQALLQKAGVSQLIDYRQERFEEQLEKGSVDYVFDLVGGDTLLRSIALRPQRIISVNYIEPEKMSKTGIQLPGLLRWVMKFSMRKYRRAAQKQQVHLIGQVSGANGTLLRAAAEEVEKIDYQVKDFPRLSLAEIAQNGFG